MASWTLVTDESLLNRSKTGPPPTLQDKAMLVTEEFGTVVSTASKLSRARRSPIERGFVKFESAVQIALTHDQQKLNK